MSWEKGINVNNVSTIICGSHVFLGVGAIEKMDFIAEQPKAKGVGQCYRCNGQRRIYCDGRLGLCNKGT